MAFRIHRGLWQFQNSSGTYETKYKINTSGQIVETDAEGNETAPLSSGGGGGDADTVDGLHASSFVRKDATAQYLRTYYEYGDYLTTQNPSDLRSQMGGGGLRVDFMHPSYAGGGSWNHVITFSGYSHYNMYQLGGYYDGGTTTNLYVRSEANHGGTGWTAWRRLLNDAADPYAVNMNQYVRTTDGPTFAEVYSNGWFRNVGTQGIYNGSYGTHFYSRSGAKWAVTGSGSNIHLEFRSNHESTLRGVVYADTSNQIGFLNNGEGWSFRTNSSNNAFVHGQTLTINADNAAWSSIYMNDGDEGMRELHCNSNRIGFLNQSGNWGAWCNDDGTWQSSYAVFDHIGVGQGVNTSYRIITNGDYYANGGGNYWAEGRFKQYRGSGTWHDVIDSGNIGDQSVNYSATTGKTNGQGGYPHAGTGMFAFYNWGGSNGGASAPTDSSYTIGISVGSHPGDQAYGFQIGRNMWNTGLWTRGYDSGWGSWVRLIDSSNIGDQSVSYASSAGNADTVDGWHRDDLRAWGNLTGVPSTFAPSAHTHDDRYYTESESDGRYVQYGSITGSFGLNDNKLYLRTNGDNNHYLWNADDDWEELNAYEGTGFRITSNGGGTGILYVYGASNGGYTYSPYSFRAPIFYDSEDTGYYLDPNGTSNVSNMTAYAFRGNGNVGGTGSASWHPNGIYSAGYNWIYGGINGGGGSATNFGDVRANIFYDAQDTGYYLDPNDTSNLWRFTEGTLNRHSLNSRQTNSPWSTRASQGTLYQTGAMGWGQVDLNVIASNWGSGFFDTWSSPANGPGASGHYVGVQAFHYNNSDSSKFHGWQMACAQEANNRWFWRSAWDTPRAWVEMIHSGNIGSQSVSYASSAGNADTVDGWHRDDIRNAANLTNQSGMWTSDARPGAYRLYRNDDNSAYNVQTTWSADVSGYWSLRGYYNDDYHAACYVARSGYADSAGSAGSVAWDNVSGKPSVATHRGEGSNYIDYSRYVYNNNAYSGSGWVEPSDLGVRYAYYGRLVYNNGAYSGSGWVEPSDLGVRYASTASAASTAEQATTTEKIDSGYIVTTSNNIYLYANADGNESYRIHHNGGGGVFDVASQFAIRPASTDFPEIRYILNDWVGFFWYNVDPWGDNWGIGPNPYSWAFVNRGNMLTFGFEDWSDRRHKSAIVEIDNAVDKVKAISGYTYWKRGSEVREGGVIAQDVLEVFPEAVGGNEEGYSIKPSALIGLLSKAVKEQQEMIDALTARIEALENK